VGPEDLLERIAASLRQDIGPAVPEPYARTQAFMAAVILEKLARQVRSQEARVEADAVEVRAMADELRAGFGTDPVPPTLDRALTDVAAGGEGSLSPLVTAVYAVRRELGDDRFDEVLARVRRALRARLDRQLAYAS
jgi:hypothetical protein